MKLVKVFIITLLALFLTGCYTQLQYSQTMKKVTDKKQTSDTPAYSWSGEEQAESSQDKGDENAAKAEYQQKKTEDYIPVYYKDYEYATKYGDVYNFYGNDWYGYNSYPYSRWGSFYSWNPFSYDRWAFHSLYGRWYDRPHYGFSISLSWGWPSYHYGYYDPFYNPYYDYYWHRYYSRYAYGYWNYYGKSGYGYGYYPDKKVRDNNNGRYGPRSIGTNRVETEGNRSRSVNRDRSAAVTNRTSSTVRTRSVGTTRTRGTSDRSSSVNRDKSRDNSSSSRSRTRGQDQIDNNQRSRYDYRSSSDEIPLVIDEKQLEEIRARIRNNHRNNYINRSRLNSDRDRTPTFFNRMKNFFEQSAGSFSNGNNGRTLRTRSSYPSTNRSAINRNSSSNNRSSVTKSKSSSSNSRSRGSSSSSRSRSDNSSSSSGSDRSRGN
ncbi:hypothetical protein [Fodinibius sp.]|uniref:hypothetical protein n=1 Tax=Fodinibius sp. TaxID=1872440 RepID=UPI002ACE71DF|nr:hypothetical protein [Fodinibius sp.]MDZ7659341.1 hypothetical protein [Fodinibius sp.]